MNVEHGSDIMQLLLDKELEEQGLTSPDTWNTRLLQSGEYISQLIAIRTILHFSGPLWDQKEPVTTKNSRFSSSQNLIETTLFYYVTPSYYHLRSKQSQSISNLWISYGLPPYTTTKYRFNSSTFSTQETSVQVSVPFTSKLVVWAKSLIWYFFYLK